MLHSTNSIRIAREDYSSPVILRDLIVECWEPTECGIDICFPPAPSVVWPTVLLDHVVVRGPFATGIRLRHCWNATLRDVFVSGVLTEQTHAQLEQATMRTAIDLGGSMDVHITNPRITCAHTGILVEDYDLGGHGEGLHVSGGFIMHAVDGIRLKGFGSGGWPTPNAWLSDLHLCVTQHGVFASRWTGLHLRDLDCYGSQLDSQPWGIFLADGCSEATITNNRCWDNRPPALFCGGIVLDDAHGVLLTGQLSRSLSMGLWATPTCTGITNQLVPPTGLFMYDQSRPA